MDNAERRANGKDGKRVQAPPIKRGAPALNLPELAQSRKVRKSTVSKAVSTAREKSISSASFQTEAMPICGDCDPGGGGGAGGTDPYFGTARTRPTNQTGGPSVTLGSRNFNWSLPVVALSGRSGLDLSISLFYNSLVWSQQGSGILYNADHGTPAPGFQIGLPRLQAQFFDADSNSNAYIMVTPSGGRVEMNQVGSTNVYESSDSAYSQLTSGSTPIVRTTDGTKYVFGVQVSAEWRCTKIEDRNGNYISATYDSSTGHILTITDTLGRVLNFNYGSDNNLSTITQAWGSNTHTWVTFNYTTVQMSFSFSGLTAYGATNGANQTVLSHVVFPENTSYHFDYNSYGQVYQIRHHAPDGHELEHTFYNIDNPGVQTDCPRFTERRDYAEAWNDGHEVTTSYAVTTGASWTTPETGATHTGTLVQQTAPDGTVYREYSRASGWDAGLTQLSEFWPDGVKKKWISTAWMQDNLALSFPQNPRVTETNIYDDGGNRRRTTVEYNQGYSLPTAIGEYAGATGQTLLRSTAMSYRMDPAYVDRRIIGLPNERVVFDGPNGNIISRQTYHYDWGIHFFSTQQPSTNFDSANYPSSFIEGRGNLVAIRRYNCATNTTAYDENLGVWMQLNGYNMAGSNIWTEDGSWHTTQISYGDSFADGNNSRNTLAFPTKVTDPDGYSSTAQYNYDLGAITRTQVPTSGAAPNITYVDVVRQYDAYGRLEQATNQTNSTYTRFVYDADGNYVHTYQTVIDLNPAHEFHSWQILDGAGRVRLTASDHPGSTGGYQGQYVIYDNMGRVKEQSNPTEINSGWVPTGDDAAGWRRTQQTYDWKGRPRETTNSDGTMRVVSYGGCGCAGGEVTTVQDEHGRQRRYTKDALSRLGTVEELNWNESVYATTSYGYNARDQITEINQAGQIRSFVYDGHGRLITRTTPEQGATNYSYNDDDTTQVVTDARLTTTTYGYNNRHQITSLTYHVSGDPTEQATATPNASFAYDAAGNRTSMSDGWGSVSYVYNNLAQMTSETRAFNGLGSYTLSYGYNLAGELSGVTNPWGAQVGYDYDKAGRLQNVSGSGYAGVSNYASSITYRAFGAVKGMSYGDTRSLSTAYDNRLRPTTWNVSNVLGYNYTYNDTHLHESTGRVSYAQSIYDATLDRSYEYDQVGRLAISHSGTEARAHVFNGNLWGTMDGPYSQGYDYDAWGNVTHKYGWGGEVQGGGAGQSSDIWYSYTGNRRDGFGYDAAGNLTNDGTQSFSYDATGQQTYASGLGAGGSAPAFTLPDPLVAGVEIKLEHLTELRAAVDQLRARAGLSAATWIPDPQPERFVTLVKADHILKLREKLEQALSALHLSTGGYEHTNLHSGDPIYAIDFQELRKQIKDAWTALASSSALSQSYDGEGLRVKKTEYGWTTWYLRSSVLGGQVIAEIDGNAVWQRGYVYAGSSLMAVQQGGVFWMHEDPVTKSKRSTDVNGNVVSAIELDPWGADTNRSSIGAFQPRKYTSYDRDGNGADEAMFRRYDRKSSRFAQPDPYNGSYNFSEPQSLNRYAYTQNDPVNFIDPTGLKCWDSFLVIQTHDLLGNVTAERRVFLGTHCDVSISLIPFGGFDPLGRGRLVNLPPSNPAHAKKIEDREIQRRIEAGNAWEKWREWDACAAPIKAKYEGQRNNYLREARTMEVFAAAVGAVGALTRSPTAPLVPVGQILNERMQLNIYNSNYRDEVTQKCGPEVPKPTTHN